MADSLAWLPTLTVVLLFLALASLSILVKRSASLSRIEAKVDLLLQNAGVRYDPYKDVPPAVSQAIARGDKIAAIKEYRDATGVGLKEAKEFVEEIQRRLPQ
jgi:ribosomal protein L7/L12